MWLILSSERSFEIFEKLIILDPDMPKIRPHMKNVKKIEIFFFPQKTPFVLPRPQFISAQLICNPHGSGPKNLPGKCAQSSAELGFEIRISMCDFQIVATLLKGVTIALINNTAAAAAAVV